MIYLTGSSGPRAREMAQYLPLGVIVQPGTGINQIQYYHWWAADNGCFNPRDYIGDTNWLRWVEKLPVEGCLFVVMPDIARRPDGSLGGDPAGTWLKFCRLAPAVKEMGLPVALAAQDGIESMGNLESQMLSIDCLFLAGSTDWKVSAVAMELCRRAQELNIWTHMGRVNTRSRYLLACRNRIDSCDGTFLKYGPDKNSIRLERWILAGQKLEQEKA